MTILKEKFGNSLHHISTNLYLEGDLKMLGGFTGNTKVYMVVLELDKEMKIVEQFWILLCPMIVNTLKMSI